MKTLTRKWWRNTEKTEKNENVLKKISAKNNCKKYIYSRG